MRYMIILHNVHHELRMYIEDLKPFAEKIEYLPKMGNVVFMESEWEKDILECLIGVKEVREPKYSNAPYHKSVLRR